MAQTEMERETQHSRGDRGRWKGGNKTTVKTGRGDAIEIKGWTDGGSV